MYSSLEDLTARLTGEHIIALADDSGDGSADTAVIEAAIADADAAIDAWLAPRYVVPFETTPPIVRALSAILAIERLFTRRRHTPPDDIRRAADDARRLLERLATGEAGLNAAGRALSESTTREATPRLDAEALTDF